MLEQPYDQSLESPGNGSVTSMEHDISRGFLPVVPALAHINWRLSKPSVLLPIGEHDGYGLDSEYTTRVEYHIQVYLASR